jgi:hypothetical protein
MQKYYLIKLNGLFNNNGITYDYNRGSGDFDCYGQTYPAEELPPSNKIFLFDLIPFIFPQKEGEVKNNISLNRQILSVNEGYFSDIHLLGACDGGNFMENFELVYNNNSKQLIKIGLTDFFEIVPVYNEKRAIYCSHYHNQFGDEKGEYKKVEPSIWYTKITIDGNIKLKEIILGDNLCMHIFAMTLKKVLK